MKQREEFEAQRQLKKFSVNHVNSALASHARRQEQRVLVVYKKRVEDINQEYAEREERLVEKLQSQGE
eukprot:2855946-Prorocentrum_lima.AAC.1